LLLEGQAKYDKRIDGKGYQLGKVCEQLSSIGER
jgi:hypothetical protein